MKRITTLLIGLMIGVICQGQSTQPCPWNPTLTFGGDIKYGTGNVFGASATCITKNTKIELGLSATIHKEESGTDLRSVGNSYLSFMTTTKAQGNGDRLLSYTEYDRTLTWTLTPTVGYRYKQFCLYGGVGIYRKLFDDVVVSTYENKDNGYKYTFAAVDKSYKRIDLNGLIGLRYHVASMFYVCGEYQTGQKTAMLGVGFLMPNSINFNK